MPRTKPVGSVTPCQKRVRTGCKTCRTRKVKCDENKPRCKNCARRGLPCDTGVQLKWEHEFTSRGLAFGRQGRWSKDRAPASPSTPGPVSPSYSRNFPGAVDWCPVPLVQSYHFINTFDCDFDLGHQAEGSGEESTRDGSARDSCGRVRSPTPSTDGSVASAAIVPATLALALPRSLSVYSSIEGVDTGLLEYYLLRLCPLTTPSRSSSPFAHLILPLFNIPGQDDVQQAAMALSARHRSASDVRWTSVAMALKGSVLASLRRRLSSVGSHAGDEWDPQILVLMMFLCLYEIVDNCDHRWVIHLRASQDIIRRSRQVEPSQLYRNFSELTRFTERFFAFQDVISRTACGNSPLFGIEYWSDERQSADVDAWMGCSPSLIGILCRITELSRRKSRGDIAGEEFERQAAYLEQELERARQPGTMAADTLAEVAELKRKSILLYHHCVLHGASPADVFVSSSVRDILEGIQDLVQVGATAGLAFPIFVAAVELDPADDQLFHERKTGSLVHGRRLILETLEAVGRCSLSNIPRTRAVIQKVWRVRDMALEEDGSPLKRRRQGPNDWSVFVGPYSSNISLA